MYGGAKTGPQKDKPMVDGNMIVIEPLKQPVSEVTEPRGGAHSAASQLSSYHASNSSLALASATAG